MTYNKLMYDVPTNVIGTVYLLFRIKIVIISFAVFN